MILKPVLVVTTITYSVQVDMLEAIIFQDSNFLGLDQYQKLG